MNSQNEKSRTRALPLRLAVAPLALAGLGALGLALSPSPARSPARPDFTAAFTILDGFIERERADKQLPAISVALVEDQRTIWSKAFGMADPAAKVPATRETVFRVGSVSKLFTDLAIMQLAERGAVDLDAPVTRYLPDFHPRNPFGKPITLRHLMSHRAGLLREPPVGHYFDSSSPSLAATVKSLNETELVYAPESHVKYSNAGVAAAGYVLERLERQPFPAYVKHALLEPMGLAESAFEPEPPIARNLAKAFLWTYDGRTLDAPTFALGEAPAGSLYSTTGDLARFLSVLFAGGRTAHGAVFERQTLEKMWTPQFARAGEKTGFGIGFRIGELEGRRAIGHGGAIYGFATELAALPDEKLGAVVVTTMDFSNAVTSHIAREALRLLLFARAGRDLPALPATSQLGTGFPEKLAGRYGEGDKAIDLIARNGEIYALLAAGGYRVRLRHRGNGLMADDRLAYGNELIPYGNGLRIGSSILMRQPDSKPAPAPARWKGLIGEYGWDYDTLYVLEKDGNLHTLIEWFEYDPLKELSDGVFQFPDYGLYDHEKLTFERRGAGRPTAVRVGAVRFERRAVGPEEGKPFQIRPLRPVEELRREALAATRPKETGDLRQPDLVELTRLDPTIRLDVRYAKSNNFLGVPLYSQERAFLQRPAAEALVRASKALASRGYGLLIHDGYRPWYVTKMFWDATPEADHIFVAHPQKGSRHNRGCAVDLTLYDLKSGKPVEMTGVYDEMSPRSYPDYPGGTSLQRWHRDLLRKTMEAEGFKVYEFEWWHFDYADWAKYPILNVKFEELGK